MHRPRSHAALALGTAAAAAAAVATLAARHTAHAASSPLHPPGAWRLAWILSLAGGFVLYAAGAWLLRRAGGPVVAVLALALVVQLAPLAGPLLLSNDAYTYWEYGRIAAVHDANPYRVAPNRFPDDRAYARMGSSWRSDTTIYGPAFTAVSEAHASVAGGSPRGAVRFYRVLAALAILAAAALAASTATRPAFAAALIGWNPLLALHFAGGGHNDAVMMAIVVGALALARAGRPGLAAPAWVAATGVKWVAAAFLPLVLIREWRAGRRLGLTALATVLYGTAWLRALGRLSSQARQTGSLGLAKWLGDLGLAHRPTVVLLAVAQLALYAWLVREASRGRTRLGVAGTGIAALQGWLNPWYASWGVALSATEEDAVGPVLSVLLCALVLRDALPL